MAAAEWRAGEHPTQGEPARGSVSEFHGEEEIKLLERLKIPTAVEVAVRKTRVKRRREIEL